MSSGRPVAILEAPGVEGRRLEETARAAGFLPRPSDRLDAFADEVNASQGQVGVLAFEALWPHPQEKLKALREKLPGTRLVVVHADDSPRLRLGQRLWAAGAMDFWVRRSMPLAEFTQVLRQAHAEASRAHPTTAPPAGDPAAHLRFLHSLSAAFANQRTVAGLLRELHMKLPSLVQYAVLQVYVPEGDLFRVHQFQTRPVDYKLVWELATQSCAALSEVAGKPILPELLKLEEVAPLPSSDASHQVMQAEGWRSVVLPMTSPQGLVGALSLLVPSSGRSEAEGSILEMISYHFATALRQTQMLEAAEQASLVDELTGCHNRRFLNALLETEWKRSVRYRLQLSIAMIDVDHFKRLNDIYGHIAGDRVLKNLARFIRAQLRDTDYLVRFGGEEFAVVLPETGPAAAGMVMERIRILVGSKAPVQADNGSVIQVSFSAGVAGFPASTVDSAEGLLKEADQALYSAKRNGRDRVCIAALPGSEPVQAEIAQSERAELRSFPRIPTRMNVRYLEIPGFESSMAKVTAADISAGGIALSGMGPQVKKHAYGLVFLEESQKPLLTKVVWTADRDEKGRQRAGLRFVNTAELDRLAHGDRERPGATHALVITQNPATRNMVSRVLRAAQYEMTFLDSAQAWPADKPLDQFGLIVVGDSTLRDQEGNPLPVLSSASNRVRIVVINESPDRKKALDTLLSHQVRHMVTADESSDEALFATLNKLLLGEYFGIRKYLLWGAQSKSWNVAYGESKAAVLDGVKEIAAEVRCHPRIADLLVMAVDEMIINALYRAPPSEGAPKKPVSVECGSDGRLLVVSVLDEHGRFKPQDLYQGLGRALEHEKQAIPREAEHANLGFRIMLDALTQLAINVEPGKATEIIGVVDLRKSLKQYRSSVPTFNLFAKD